MSKQLNYKSIFISIWCIAACMFHLYTSAYGILPPLQQRSIHLLFLLPLTFILFPLASNKENNKFLHIIDLLLVVLSIVGILYVTFNAEMIDKRVLYLDKVTPLQIVLGTTTLLLVLEATRRAVSRAMAIFALVFIAYLFLCPYLPGILNYKGMSFPRFIEVIYLFQDSGVFGMLTGISATYVFIFVLLASVISTLGIGRLFTNLSCRIAGKTKGGPAKVAVISSALFGSISGVATANVYATGSFTIPMMKKLGYKSDFAGSVESAASTGGLIMPPIMGVGAFVIAELTGMHYIEVCKAALLPAILYYFGIFVSVHFQSLKYDLSSLDDREIPTKKDIIDDLHLIIPLIVLVVLLLFKYTAFKSAYFAIIIAVLVSFLRKKTRINLQGLIDTFVQATKNALMVGIACCCAGIIVAIITFTGLAVSFSSNLLSLSNGVFLIAAAFIMLSSIILGMGLPCTVAYVIAVSVGGPALMKFGAANLIQIHLFVYYFAILAAITPPVCMASYAAASIAHAEPFKVGFLGIKLAFVGFIVPYIFIRNESLLMNGSVIQIILSFVFCLISFYLLAIGLTGYWKRYIGGISRALLILVPSIIIFSEINILYKNITILLFAILSVLISKKILSRKEEK